ncbi:MAG: riboflavin synthase [Thiohalomonadales bacterium]
MFTGLIQATGSIHSIQKKNGDARFSIAVGKLPMSQIELGDSIAVNGVCLTAVELNSDNFQADVSLETLQCSSFNQIKSGAAVNLELALTPTTRLGGHLVSGHVDGVGEIIGLNPQARSLQLQIKAPQTLMKYIAAKGSICVDGVSLTINSLQNNSFELNIVPHTLTETIIGTYRIGSHVNLEVDLIARYLERLILGDMESTGKSDSLNGISQKLLAEHGFIE